MTIFIKTKKLIIEYLSSEKIEKLIWFFCILLISLFTIKCISVSQTETFSFDGAINAQVSQNLINNFSYSTSYDGGKTFDPIIQTGVTVLFPLALFFYLFGTSFNVGLIINIIYCILLLLEIIYFINNCLKLHSFFSLIFILLFYSTPQIFTFGFGLFGEIPTLFFIFLGIIFLSKFEVSLKQKYIILSGFSLGFAYLTKTVALIIVPSLILFFLLIYFDREKLKIKLKKLIIGFLSAFLIPILFFEIFKILIFRNLHEYFLWWKDQSVGIFQQAGVVTGFQDTNGILHKLSKHLEILSDEIKIPIVLIVLIFLLLGIVLIGFLYFEIKKVKGVYNNFPSVLSKRTFIIILTITFSYIGWWLLITPTQKAWFRRIINGYILLEVCIVVTLYIYQNYIYKRINSLKKYKLFKFIILLLLYIIFVVILVFTPYSLTNYKISFMDSELKQNTEEASNFIHSLPSQSQFFGFGWWQAPVLSFEAEKEFDNLDFNIQMSVPGIKNNKYLVIDSFAKKTAENEYSKILEEFIYQELFTNDDYEILELLERKFHTYEPFTLEDKKLVDNNFIDFSTDPIYGYFRNVYSDEPDGLGKWSKMYSGYLLKNGGENHLIISIWIPELTRYENDNLNFDIHIDNFLVSSNKLRTGGLHEFTIPIKTKGEDTIEVSLFLNGRIKEKVDTRELAFRIISIKLEN